ncbi:hypothetical protein [Actinoallomurus rhizosphaericola]|uniref:hypothetical protein n=1 Tax=Actinoallomurus rhizosphaericola TaxID=2952536 RepID=UPI00209021B9|nr:hypothetical protein [Actinoallomurus rhizosphaericola]MCO5993938.1 hypothetical protein [Actinoallomurus rhizosphaericola]
MRRFATLVATGAVAATAAIALAAGPASASTTGKAEALKVNGQPQVSTAAVATPHAWALSNTKSNNEKYGVAGASASGRWGLYTSKGKKKIKVTIHLMDTDTKDGKFAGLQILNPSTKVVHNYYVPAGYVGANDTKYFWGKDVYVREALVNSKGSVVKTGKSWKKLGS